MPGCPYPEVCPSAGAGGEAGDGSSSLSCPMSMFFTSSSSVCVFLQSWRVHSALQWLLLAVSVLAMAVCREWCVASRQHRARQRRVQLLDRRRKRLLQLRLAEANDQNPASKDPPPIAASSSSFSSPLSAGLSQPLMEDGVGGPLQVGAVDGSTCNSASLTSPTSLWSSLSASDVWVGAGDGLSYALSLLLAYLLMLLVMTYNVAVLAIVVVASSLAHVAVSLHFTATWRRQRQSQTQTQTQTLTETEAQAEAEAEERRRRVREEEQVTGAQRLPLCAATFHVDESLRAASDPCCNDLDIDR